MGEDEEWVARDAASQGVPVPPRIANKPSLMEGLGLFYTAFHRLSTCRSMGFGIGPVPWDKIEQYADSQEFDQDHRYALHYHITAMDRVFLNHCNKKPEKPSKNSH